MPDNNFTRLNAQEAHNCRESFFRKFSTFTQHMYLLCYSAGHISDADVRSVAREIKRHVRAFADSVDPLWNDKIVGEPRRLREALPTLPAFVIELLIVKLDAMLHELLDTLGGRMRTGMESEQSRSFEEELQDVKSTAPEAYKWVIMLAEVRNAIIHNSSILNEARFNRLRDAGWNDSELKQMSSRMPNALTVSDLLKMKGGVRTAANIALEKHGSTREDLAATKAI